VLLNLSPSGTKPVSNKKANESSPVEKDFEAAVAKIKKLWGGRKTRKLSKKQ